MRELKYDKVLKRNIASYIGHINQQTSTLILDNLETMLIANSELFTTDEFNNLYNRISSVY